MADAEIFSLLTHPFLTNIILPFLLIFTIIFAILEKTEVLGKEKKVADIIVALVFGFIFVGAQAFVGFTLRIIPLIAVFVVVLLAYFIIFGFMGIEMNTPMKSFLGVLFGIAFVVALLWATGLLEKVLASRPSADVIGMVVLVVLLGGAITLVTLTGKKSGAAK